jgi:hypothetical protein
MILLGVALSLLLVFFISQHERYRILDDRKSEDDIPLAKKWHFYKGCYQAIITAIIGLGFGWRTALLFLGVFSVYHDALINTKVLNVPIYYEGETAWLDNKLRWIFRTNKNVFIFKILVLILALVFICMKSLF